MSPAARLLDRSLQAVADALIALLFFADRKHVEWANLTNDEVER